MKFERKEFLRLTDASNKGNGYRFGRAIGFGKSISLHIPRDRLGHFYPVLLTIIKSQEEELQRLAFNLYSKGLTTRDVGEIFEDIYGKAYSKTSISRINQSFQEEIFRWRNRTLNKHYPVLMIDALHTRIRRASSVEVEAVYTVLALQDDMTRDIIAVESIPQESASGWEWLLKRLKERGLENVDLIIADGLTGLEQSIANVFPSADFQKCVTHMKRNILTKVRSYHKG